MKSVIGIDPGSEKSAYVQWDGKTIIDKGIHPNEELLNLLKLLWVADPPRDIVLAIESIVSIHDTGGKSVIDTIRWEERFFAAWEGKKEFVPGYVIRKALGAKDNTGVRWALIQRFGAPGTAKNPGFTYDLQRKGYHLWRAFAVAVVWHDHLEFQGREINEQQRTQ